MSKLAKGAPTNEQKRRDIEKYSDAIFYSQRYNGQSLLQLLWLLWLPRHLHSAGLAMLNHTEKTRPFYVSRAPLRVTSRPRSVPGAGAAVADASVRAALTRPRVDCHAWGTAGRASVHCIIATALQKTEGTR